MSSAALRARCATQPRQKERSAASAEDDARHAPGMLAEGDDWSARRHSERTDRPLPREVVRELSRKSDMQGLSRLAGHSLAIALTAWFILWAVRGADWLRWGLCLPLGLLWQGFLLSAMGFAMQHECMHLTAFRTRRLNLLVGFLGSIPAFSFFEHELLMHKDHHTYTGDPRRDTELLSGGDIAVGSASKPGYRKVPETHAEYVSSYVRLDGYLKRKLQKLVYCAAGVPVDYSATSWSCYTPHGDVNTRGTPGNRLKHAARLQLAAIAGCLLIYLAFLGDWRSLCWTWLLPMLVGPAPLFYLQLHEHADCSMDANGLTNTRTTITHPVVSYFMWEMGYHAEHHLYTFIPFWQLPAAHQHLKHHLSKISKSHAEVHVRTWRDWIPQQAAGVRVGG